MALLCISLVNLLTASIAHDAESFFCEMLLYTRKTVFECVHSAVFACSFASRVLETFISALLADSLSIAASHKNATEYAQ